MTDTVRRPLVRPAFLKWSLVTSVLLIPVMLHAAWDYYEARRIDRALTLIRQNHEPTGLQQVEPRRIETFRAAAYYQAGAALAAEFRQDDSEPRRAPVPAPTTLLFRVRRAERENTWTDELWAELRQYVHDREEALAQLDRATWLPFEGFRRGTSYSYLAASQSDLARLGGYRTMVRARDGEGDAGARSLYTELRLRRAIGPSMHLLPTVSDVIAHLDLLLNRTRPASEALTLVAAGLAEIDRDDELKRWFLYWRAGFIDTASGPNPSVSMTWRGVPPLLLGIRATAERPWTERVIANRLDTLAAIIGAVGRPWPERVNAVSDAYASRGVPAEDRTGFKRTDLREADAIIRELTLVRCARVAVAIERYRREHAERMPSAVTDLIPDYSDAVPVDPYSGGAVLMRPEGASYAVYSVGPNRRDEQGDFSVLRSVEGRQERRDVGLRIQYR